MSSKRTILVEAALVVGVLATGIAAASAAKAAPISIAMQGVDDPRANVKIESRVQVERTEQDAAGNVVSKLVTPSEVKVVPGDKLVFTNAYKNTGTNVVTGFVVNNPIHSAVSFTSVEEDWAVVSVDGGKTFAKLADITITEAVAASADSDDPAIQNTRPAQPSDVTHIRWVFAQPIAAGASGELRFSGVVK